jgi:hypothetical protein
MEQDAIHRIKSELDVVMLCRFGSHLYGTDTPESDVDYKGIFMPTLAQIYLGKIPKSVRFDSNNSNQKNSNEDVDAEMYSLHYFIELACKGETAALDMLHVNSKNLLVDSLTWTNLAWHKERFYTRNLKAFVGYARKQAAKYGLKGTRLACAENLIHILSKHDGSKKVRDMWNDLPDDEHCFRLDPETTSFPTYQWCGKQVQNTVTVNYFREMLLQFVSTFGERARQAQANEGIDWKAMSHAIRAAYEVRQILKEGQITFPLGIASCLTDIKLGRHDFTGYVLPLLEELMEEVEALSECSTLPMKVNRSFWDEFVCDEVHERLRR